MSYLLLYTRSVYSGWYTEDADQEKKKITQNWIMPEKGVYSEIIRNIYLAYMVRIPYKTKLVWTDLLHDTIAAKQRPSSYLLRSLLDNMNAYLFTIPPTFFRLLSSSAFFFFLLSSSAFFWFRLYSSALFFLLFSYFAFVLLTCLYIAVQINIAWIIRPVINGWRLFFRWLFSLSISFFLHFLFFSRRLTWSPKQSSRISGLNPSWNLQ